MPGRRRADRSSGWFRTGQPADDDAMTYIVPATAASTSSPTTASTRSPAGNAAAGTQPGHRGGRRSDRGDHRRGYAPSETAERVDGRPVPHRAVDAPAPSQLRASTAHRYGWMIDNYINPRSATPSCAACVSNTSTGSITTFSPLAAAPVGSSRPRRSTTSMSSCAHRSLTPHDAASSPPTSRSRLTHPTPNLAPMWTRNVDRRPAPPLPDERC